MKPETLDRYEDAVRSTGLVRTTASCDGDPGSSGTERIGAFVLAFVIAAGVGGRRPGCFPPVVRAEAREHDRSGERVAPARDR